MSVTSTTENAEFRIIQEACWFSADRSKAKIVVESKERDNFAAAIEKLDGVAVKNMAIGYAASEGVSDPRLEGLVRAAYAVNSKGVELDKASGENNAVLPAGHPDKQPAAYRVDIPLIRKLV